MCFLEVGISKNHNKHKNLRQLLLLDGVIRQWLTCYLTFFLSFTSHKPSLKVYVINEEKKGKVTSRYLKEKYTPETI